MADPTIISKVIFCGFNILNYLLIYYLLLIFSPFDDDLSQEKYYWDNQSCQQEPEGEIEMFQSQGFGFIIWSFHFEHNFSENQSSLESQNVIYYKLNTELTVTCWNLKMWLLNSSARVHFLFNM